MIDCKSIIIPSLGRLYGLYWLTSLHIRFSRQVEHILHAVDKPPEVWSELVMLDLKILEFTAIIGQGLEHSFTVFVYMVSMKHQLSYVEIEKRKKKKNVNLKQAVTSYSLNMFVLLNAPPART